jgi:SAM-dependent methyltransferase
MDKITVPWQSLKKLSDKHFKWHTTHFSRKWEYPWACSRLDELDIDRKAILDAGAGMSPIALWLAQRGAVAMTIDSGLQRGKGAGFIDYEKHDSRIVSFKGDFAKMTWLPLDGLDAIVSISVIEHIPAAKRRKAWIEWHRVLKPGGWLIMTLDLVGPSDRLLNKCDQKRIEPNKVHGYLSDVRRKLKHSGFVEMGAAICPYKRRLSRRERTTHVIGLVLRAA